MKKTLATVVASLVLLSQASAQYINLGSLGTSNFTPDIDGSTATFSQTGSTLNFTAASLGDQVFGDYIPTVTDWSVFTDFGIRMTITGTNPDLPFTVSFFDDEFASNVYTGFTTGLSSGVSGVAPLTLVSSSANLANVIGFQLGWDGTASGAINVSMSDVAAVPEPSTYALLALASLALGVYALRRRRVA
jgi:hypothetical protein